MRTWPDKNGSAIGRFLRQRRLRHPQTPTFYHRVLPWLPGCCEAMRALIVAGKPTNLGSVAARARRGEWCPLIEQSANQRNGQRVGSKAAGVAARCGRRAGRGSGEP